MTEPYTLLILQSLFILAKPIKIDLGFIFGAVGPDGDRRFSAAKDLAKRMVEKYDISNDAALFGGIVYDDSARLQWKIGDATDLKSTVYRINELTRRRRGSNLQKALEVARDELFTLENGARRNIPKTLVVFFDGNPADSSLPFIAKELKDSGVKIIVIAIGSGSAFPGMQGIASSDKDFISTPDLARMMNDTLKTALLQSKPGKFHAF